MNASAPAIRLSLFALTASIIISTTIANAPRAATAMTGGTNADALPTVSFETITVHADAKHLEVAQTTLSNNAIRVLPTIYVQPTEAEMIAAHIDPTDQIQIFDTITIRPDPSEQRAAALRANRHEQGDDNESFRVALGEPAVEHHRLRLDMPYYSFGKILTHVPKN